MIYTVVFKNGASEIVKADYAAFIGDDLRELCFFFGEHENPPHRVIDWETVEMLTSVPSPA